MKLAIAALLALGSGPLQAQVPSYRYEVASASVVDLGTIGGENSAAFDINNAGNIVGWANNFHDQRHAVLFFADGRWRDIGSWFNPNESEARGINNLNHVVGFSIEGTARHAFRWSTTGLVMLNERGPDPDEIETESEARAIADTGQIAGWRTYWFPPPPVGVQRWGSNAVIWQDEHDYTTLSTENYAIAIDLNASNTFVGADKRPTGHYRWRIVAGLIVRTAIPFPPPLTGHRYVDGTVGGINASGAIVGYYYDVTDRSRSRAYYWDGRAANSQDLGLLPTGTYSIAEDINDTGFITGWANIIDTLPGGLMITTEVGFLYHRDFGFYRLPAPTSAGLRDCRAMAVNARNSTTRTIQVAGTCESSTRERAVRWDVIVRMRPLIL